MESLKYVLIGALAVVSYLLLLAWQEDYPATVVSETATQTTIPASIDTPTVSTTLNPVSSADIPVVGSSNSQIPVPAGNTRIQVVTDVLRVTLDRNGGDILEVSLPEYRRQIDVENDPFVLLESSSQRTYVAKSGLVGRNGIDSTTRALYTASADSFTLSNSADSIDVDLQYVDTNGVQITKRFTFERGNYLIKVRYIINNASNDTWQANLFGQINRTTFPDPSSIGGVGMSSFMGFAATSLDDPYFKVEFSDIDSGITPHELLGGWIAMSQHYFLSAWIPAVDALNTYTLRRSPQNPNEYIAGFTGPEFTVAPGTSVTQESAFYAGPKDQYVLKEISPNLDLTIDYGWLWFVASPIYWLLTKINALVGNLRLGQYLLLTVTVKGIFYKLSATSYRSMANMRRVMPKMVQLKERFGDDKMKLQKATMELYQKEKINPFRWMFAHACPDASVHCSVLGIDGKCRITSGAFHTLDQ